MELIWRPDLLVYNKLAKTALNFVNSIGCSANMNVRESEMMTNALVQHDGRVSLFRAIITDITCHLNLVIFPSGIIKGIPPLFPASVSIRPANLLFDAGQLEL